LGCAFLAPKWVSPKLHQGKPVVVGSGTAPRQARVSKDWARPRNRAWVCCKSDLGGWAVGFCGRTGKGGLSAIAHFTGDPGRASVKTPRY